MSLTTDRAPFGPNPAGRFADGVYVEPFLRRVRAFAGERLAIDSQRVLLVHRPGRPPDYAFPAADVHDLPATAEPAARGYVRVAWDAATAWYEEEDEVFGGHPRNPYHRIDCVRARRRLRAEVGAVVLVDTLDVIALYETSRAPQLYARRSAVRMDLLAPSATVTYCPYKGTATHWTAEIDGRSVPDVAWSYENPLPESAAIAGMLCFYPERARVAQEILTWFSTPPAEHDSSNA